MAAPTATRSLPQAIPTTFIGHDQVILLPDGHSALVTSKSDAGAWWLVVDHRCECPGFAGIPGTDFTGRGHCRHVDAVKAAEDLDRATAEPIELNEPGSERSVVIPFPPSVEAIAVPDPICGSGWVVEWAGTIHGGHHGSQEEALEHADYLNALPLRARNEWLADHRGR